MSANLKVGDQVLCPADRGANPYKGEVVDVGEDVQFNGYGKPFMWVTVRGPSGHKSVWPSNRLTLCN